MLMVLIVGFAFGATQSWKPVEGRMSTRWAGDVKPESPLPEYPRPTMVRSQWKSLNGLWEFADAREGEAPPIGKALPERILVPYPVESSLSGVERHAERAWYRTNFGVPSGWRNRRILLHFGAVDWEARVWLNGRELGVHRGGYDAFTFDITEALNAKGPQELVVGVWDTMDEPGPNARGKQIREPKDIWFSAVTGIWQTVWIEPVNDVSVDSLKLTPDIDTGVLNATINARGDVAGVEAEVVALHGRREIARVKDPVSQSLTLAIPKAKLWTPENPHLYDLRVVLKKDGKVVDKVESYFGMRKISVMKDARGVLRLALNNEIRFQIGPLDQGYWPDGLYTAPTDDALKYDVEITKRLGFNMTRKHVKVEPERWYYWCDKLGLLVWQDMPNGFNFTPEWRQQFETELRRMVEGRYNHPSIVMWVVFNESWGQYEDTPRVTAMVKEWDPSRLVNNASGWNDHGVGDVVDKHIYPGPSAPPIERNRAAVLGEFGGTWASVPGHVWKQLGIRYRSRHGKETLTRRYEDLLHQTYALRDTAGLSAAVYTELTDVEVELAGLLTYDREVLKVDEARVRNANKGIPPDRRPAGMVLPTSETHPTEWRYTTESPVEGWEQPGFDDCLWKTGGGGFGIDETPGSLVKTRWDSGDIWLRRRFDWHASTSGQLVIRIHHDEDAEVWLNGTHVLSDPGFLNEYLEIPLPATAKRLLKPKDNVLTIHCRQTEGGQFVDAGLGIRK